MTATATLTKPEDVFSPEELAFINDEEFVDGGDEGEQEAVDGATEGDEVGDGREEVLDDGTSEDDLDDVSEDNSEEDESSWITQEVKDYAGSFDLKEDDLKDFESLEDLKRFGRLMDRRLSESPGKKPEDATEGGGASVSTSESDATPDLLDIDKMKEEEFDPQAIAMAERINAMTLRDIEREKAEEESRQQAARESGDALVREFDSQMDNVDELVFGKSGEMNAAQSAARGAVYERMAAIQDRMVKNAEAEGREAPKVNIGALRERAIDSMYGDRFSGKTDGDSGDSKKKKVAERSARRRPVSSSAASKRKTPKDTREMSDVELVESDPAFNDRWEKIIRRNG